MKGRRRTDGDEGLLFKFADGFFAIGFAGRGGVEGGVGTCTGHQGVWSIWVTGGGGESMPFDV